MATWTHTVGAATEHDNSLQWLDISAHITDTTIADHGSGTFLSRIDITDGTFAQVLRTNGPELSNKWERSHVAITISAGGLTVIMPGPNASVSAFKDSTEPYSWTVSAAKVAEFVTFIAAYKDLSNSQKNSTTVTLDDTPPDAEAPPVTISAVTDADEFDALELSATVTHPTIRAYDRLSYSWQVVSGGGSLSTPVNTPTGSDPTRSSVTYTPADVSSDTNVQVRCTVTAEGSNAFAASGTSDTETDTENFVVNFIDDSSTDTEQEFPVGAPTSSTASQLQWLDLGLWVQAGLRASTATHARLHSVILSPGVIDAALRLQQFSGDSEFDAGPDLISDFELSGHIIIEAGGESHTIYIAPDSSNPDTADPYTWNLSDEQPLRDFITAYNALSGADKAGTTVTLRVPPSVTAPTVVITDLSSVDENATVELSLGLSGGSYDAATYAWTVVSGGGSFADATLDTVTFTPADVSADTAVQVRCTVTVTGNGSNAFLDSTTNVVATETFTVNYVPPDTVAPTITIGSVAAFDENSTAALNANVSGGTYDSLSYAWSVVSGGGSITNTGASVIYNPPDITADTDVTVRCTVTADGTGGDAKSGTSDTATDTVLFTVNFIPGAINAEGSASINLSFTATGDAGLNEAPALNAEGSASINLSFTATGDAGLNEAPALSAEGSASINLSFTATGDAGLGDLSALNAEGSASINLSFTATGDAGLGDPPLVLADWTTPTDETVIVLALVQANISGVDLFDAPGDEVGTGNDLVIGADLSLDMVERHASPQPPVRLRGTGGGEFSPYFSTGGTYESAALYIQTTPTKVIGFTHGNSGGGYSNWNYADSSDASDFTGISTGDRFIVAITTPAVHASLNAEGSASINLSFTATGDAGLGDPPALSAEGAASINLSFTATGDAGLGNPPALNAEGSASINLSFTATGDAGLGDPPLVLADWTTPTDETVIVLALVQANISGVDLFDAPGDEVGTGNDLVIGADLSLDMVERHASPQPPVRLRGTGGGEFSPYFSTGGTYESAALYIQTTPTKVIGFTHGNSGGGYSNWNYADSSDASDFTGISTGDRFIVAITTPAVHASLNAEGSASINLSFTATGDAGLGDPPALSAEGAASINLVVTATGDAGLNEAPALNAEGSASINLSFTAAGDAGLNEAPALNAEGSASINLSFTAAGDAGLNEAPALNAEGSASINLSFTAAGDAGLNEAPALNAEGSASINLSFTAAGHAGLGASLSLNAGGSASINLTVDADGDAALAGVASAEDARRKNAMSLAGQAPIYAIEISHPALTDPVRAVADTIPHTIEGNDFPRLFFRFVRPQDQEKQVSRAQAEIDNVGAALTEWVETTNGGRGATMRVMEITPAGGVSEVTWEVSLGVVVSEILGSVVRVTLQGSRLHGRRLVLLRHDPSTSPGAFD